MSIALEQVGDVAVLQPKERLDVATGPVFEEAMQRIFEDGRGRHVVIDLENVTYVSSLGLAACLRGAKLARTAGRRIALAGLESSVANVFEVSGLAELFERFPTRTAALASFGATGSGSAAILSPTPTARARDRAPHLTLPEEILLLALHDEGGDTIELPDHALEFALAGSVLMELCARRRVDSDLENLSVVDATPVGDDVLDPALARIAGAEATHDARHWIRMLAHEAGEIRRRLLDRLVARGILRRAGNRLLWALGQRRYPMVDDTEQREVKERVTHIIQSDEVPDPRDVVLIALADACAIFDAILGMDEMLEARLRIADVVRMDLIAQAMSSALAGMQEQGRLDGDPSGIYREPTHGIPTA